MSCVFFLVAVSGCGAKSAAVRELDGQPAPEPTEERCNGADDDFDQAIDEDFRDSEGRYIDDAHCGACNQACLPATEAELEVRCTLIDESPVCAAIECAAGYAVGSRGRCVRVGERLCLECGDDVDCGAAPGARCANVGGEPRCVVGCDAGCPGGYRCEMGECRPEGGSCRCDVGDDFEVACAVPLDDPDAPVCVGRARCVDGVLSGCGTSEDVCDEVDNDCDGVVDQDFVDDNGVYSVDIDHCGQCGVSCQQDTGTDLALRCGGDPFVPSCVIECPDAFDGVQPGDMLDGDFDILTGCECLVTDLDDVPGPVGAEGAELDTDCDGADGKVIASYYVASDGDDEGPGSPSRPLRSLTEALDRALLSQDGAQARVDVFVAGGTYTEFVQVPAGMRIHGGYRRDFRRLDRAAFETEIRAPAETAPAGAAMVVFGAPGVDTLIEGLTLRGSDARAAGEPAVAAGLVDVGPELTVRDTLFFAGLPGEGSAGNDGEAGQEPAGEAGDGQPPRSAVEDADHLCQAGNVNRVRGGSAGRNTCGDASVAGGAGGSASCPLGGGFSGSGQNAAGATAAGGRGGAGGKASSGPITNSPSVCPSPPCCGLADFSVDPPFSGPEPGESGVSGEPGVGGRGCTDGFGRFLEGSMALWQAGQAQRGSAGDVGLGGGGGGAGGGSQFEWMAPDCTYADGLGGGGGGGGAGGCGGTGGRAGSSGAPSVALVVLGTRGSGPNLSGLTLGTAGGARGGPGGAGGDGGRGGSGGFGGELPSAELSIPPLSASFPGARGGKGGDGGPGGGGGGGCGGASVGIWVVEGRASSSWSSNNTFELGEAGEAGIGGGGGSPGEAGRSGGRVDVHVQ